MDAATYRRRRNDLRSKLGGRRMLFPAHQFVSRNYPDNWYPYRQSSHLLYLTGIDQPEMALLMGGAEDEDILYGPGEDVDHVVWHGPTPTLAEYAKDAGIGETREHGTLANDLKSSERPLYLPPVQPGVARELAQLFELTVPEVASGASSDLAHAIMELRAVKSADEIAEIENALGVTARMHVESMRVTAPGVRESEVAAAVQRIALAENRAQSYNPIISVRGEVLHNNEHGNVMEAGQVLLNDSGAESPGFYASDITRSYPVSGKFEGDQKKIYQTVLDSQMRAIEAVGPGKSYRDIHLLASRVLAEGLTDAGLMKGDAEKAVEAGAHALFFPHGLGHMLGLDVHDMEDLGDVVGYQDGDKRSEQFGLNFLRMARPLEPGYVFTVEPGVYFIPALIDRWKGEGRHTDFIDYDRVNEFRGFGGIRIEDDIVCTEDGGRVLGPAIPKTVEEVEATMAS